MSSDHDFEWGVRSTVIPLPHQSRVIRARLAAHDIDVNRVQIDLPCGSGKTLAAIWYALQSGRFPCVVITHSVHILNQWYDALLSANESPSDIARVYGSYRDDTRQAKWVLLNHLVRPTNDLRKLRPETIIGDEYDRSAAPTYSRWLLILGIGTDRVQLTGLSGTPYRRQGKRVIPIEEWTFGPDRAQLAQYIPDPQIRKDLRMSFLEAAVDGIVAMFDHETVQTNADVDLELGPGDDFTNSTLSMFDTPKANAALVKHWRQNAPRFGKSCFFVGTADHARNLAQAFGPDARYVTHKMDPKQVFENLQAHREGAFPVLVCVRIPLYGYDCPDIRTILAPVTASPNYLVQALGRGSRIVHPNKYLFTWLQREDRLHGDAVQYLAGSDFLGTGEFHEALAKRRKIAKAIQQTTLSEILQDLDMAALIASSTPEGTLTQYGGYWLAFTDEGVRAPVSGLLPKADCESIVSAAGISVKPSDRGKITNGTPTTAKIREALGDGLTIHVAQFRDVSEIARLRSELKNVSSSVGSKLRIRPNLSVAVSVAVDRLLRDAKGRTLSFADGAKLATDIKSVAPELATYTPDILQLVATRPLEEWLSLGGKSV